MHQTQRPSLRRHTESFHCCRCLLPFTKPVSPFFSVDNTVPLNRLTQQGNKNLFFPRLGVQTEVDAVSTNFPSTESVFAIDAMVLQYKTPTQTPELQYALAIILTIGPSILVALRFRARYISRVPRDWDDWLIVIALVSWQCGSRESDAD